MADPLTAQRQAVVDAITATAAGGTVNIPTGNVFWILPITVSKNITIKGAGIGQTTINGPAMFVMNPNLLSTARTRLSGFTFNRNDNQTLTDGVENGTNTFASASAVFKAADVGKAISGSGIPNGTTIATFVNVTTITLSNVATLNQGGIQFTIAHRLNIGPYVKWQGTCPIDEANITNDSLSGGMRMDHILMQDPISVEHSLEFFGWIEGVVDHCIINNPLANGGAEHIIFNLEGAPDGSSGHGDYSWSTAIGAGTCHGPILEDLIIHRTGGTDTNSFSVAGGGRYTARHCTTWGSLGGGHGSRDSSGSRVFGQRLGEAYKNLFVLVETPITSLAGPNTAKAQTNVRSGESVIWGNRSNRYGGSAGTAQNKLTINCNCIDTWQGGSPGPAINGADGTGMWDFNWKGSIPLVNGIANFPVDSTYNYSYSPSNSGITNSLGFVDGLTGTVTNGVDSQSTRGDVYAHGVGGTNPSAQVITLNGLNTSVADKWKDFVVRNLAKAQNGATPLAFAYIESNDLAGNLSLRIGNEANPSVGTVQFSIAAGEPWEIRRVRSYFLASGKGKMDMSADPATFGAYPATRLVDGSIHWTHQGEPGCSQWDNKFRNGTSGSPGAWTTITSWQGTSTYEHALTSAATVDTANPVSIVHNGPWVANLHPGYSYDPNVAAGTLGTLVGADDEAWGLCPTLLKMDGVSTYTASEINSITTEGGNGGYTYPHPFVSAVPGTPAIVGGSTGGITFTTNAAVDCAASPKSNCYQFTTSNFTAGTIDWDITSGSPPTGVTLNNTTFRGRLSGVPTSSTSTFTVRARNITAGESATQDFTVTVTSPNQIPKVSITAPTANQSITGTTVSLKASAQDQDGQVKKVDFYRATITDPVLIGTVTGTDLASYDLTWTGVAPGSYTITAKATDNSSGVSDASTAVDITVNAVPALPPPTIVVTG